jgi:hypothetical protein
MSQQERDWLDWLKRADASTAAATQRVRGTDPVGHFRTRLVGKARAGALSGTDDRRCNQLELGPVCGKRFDRLQHGGAGSAEYAVFGGQNRRQLPKRGGERLTPYMRASPFSKSPLSFLQSRHYLILLSLAQRRTSRLSRRLRPYQLPAGTFMHLCRRLT